METTMTQQITRAEIPAIVREYLDRHRIHDKDGTIATFAPDAIVQDEGRTYQGTAEIRSWLENASTEYTYTVTETGYERLDDDHVTVRAHLEGNFPGGEADIAYEFTLSGGVIGRLEIH